MNDAGPGSAGAMAAMRAAMHELRGALDAADARPDDAARAHAEELTRALAERDRRAVSLSAENETLRAAAQARLDLLEANDRAYAAFKALLRARIEAGAPIEDLLALLD